tara:strand:+ start:873 stop:1151 length:279 start_codon:yes stop_codon:yes gene_type:complete
VPVGLADLVVTRAQVGAGSDEVDVVVGVVVLFELGRHHPVAGQRRGRRQRLDDVAAHGIVVVGRRRGRAALRLEFLLLLRVAHDFDALLRGR